MLESLDFTHIQQLTISSTTYPVRYLETEFVKPGVRCEVYERINDTENDFGVIVIDGGNATPWQKVAIGGRIFEHHLMGKGRLCVCASENLPPKIYEVSDEDSRPLFVEILVGQIISWQADSELVVVEGYEPKYAPGRFIDMPDDWKPVSN